MKILPLIKKGGNGNTRPELKTKVKAHCDYLRIAITKYDFEKFESLMNFLDKKWITEIEVPWSPGAGAVWFEHRVNGARGLRGGWTLDKDKGVVAMIDLPGEYWEMLTPVDQWRIFRGLKYTYNVRCCRVDSAVDDPSYKIIPIKKMVKAYEEKNNYFFRRHRYICSQRNPDEKRYETYEFGSRQSGQFVRVYDHEGECLRFETEFKGKKAVQIFDIINSIERPPEHYDISPGSNTDKTVEELEEEFSLIIMRKMAGIAVGAIDFRDRGKSKSSSTRGTRDAKRLPFYEEFVNFLQTTHMHFKLPPVPRSVHRTFEWIKRQCSSTLAMFKEGLGAADFFLWVNQLLGLGFERMDRMKVRGAEEISKYKHRFRIA